MAPGANLYPRPHPNLPILSARAISSKFQRGRWVHLWHGLQSKREVKCWIHKGQMSCEQLFRGEGGRGLWAEMHYEYIRVNGTYHYADFSKGRAKLE